MKALAALLLLATLAQPATACVEPTPQEVKAALTAAGNYVVDSVLSRKGVETFLTTVSTSIVDCHDYDGEFDNLEIQLAWRQNVKGVYQSCEQVVRYTYTAEFDSSEEIQCRSDK